MGSDGNGSGNGTVELMLIGEHKLFRECLGSMLGDCEGFRVVDHADGLAAAVGRIRREPPEVILIDLGTADEETLERLREITHDAPELKVIVLGLPEVEEEILRCIEAGVSGYVLKESSIEELREAIQKVLRGEAICSPQITGTLFSHLAALAREQRGCERLAGFDLTPREGEILELIAESLSNKEIAERLCLSLYTVKNHVHNILEKLQVSCRGEAVEQAYRRRWLRRARRSA
jgi:DNA-binding NarL/FixJ family response regulator